MDEGKSTFKTITVYELNADPNQCGRKEIRYPIHAKTVADMYKSFENDFAYFREGKRIITV